MIEENSKKIAATLCLASCFPVVTTVYAIETSPEINGNKFITEGTTDTKNCQEMDENSYYFDETSRMNNRTTEENEVTHIKKSKKEKEKKDNTLYDINQDEVDIDNQNIIKPEINDSTIQNNHTTVIPEENIFPSTKPNVEISPENENQNVITPEVILPEYVEPETQIPETIEPEIILPEYTEPETQTPEIIEPEVILPEYTEPETQIPEIIEPEVILPEYTEPETQIPEIIEPELPNLSYSEQVRAKIAEEALKLIGITDGLQCTQVVQLAMANAGISNAMQLWPDQYIMYGEFIDASQAQPGDLIYYNNGGRGVDHIAVYIGNGQAVHGNWGGTAEIQSGGKTVIEQAYLSWAGSPQFIRINI